MGILQSDNKKSLPNVKLSSDTWRRRWDSPAPLQQSAGLLQPGGTQSAGPYELRLPIFLQPLGGALKNRSAAPASPPCFRRRRTGCGTQHPLRLACVSLAAAPTTPRCFRRWRRSSSLQSAPLLFESTLATLYKLPDKTETPVSLQHWSSWWSEAT